MSGAGAGDRAALLARIRAALRSRVGSEGDDSDITDLPATAFSEVPQSALEALSARLGNLAANGQPIADLFADAGDDAAARAGIAMINGLAQGPLAIVQQLAQILQIPQNRAETIARNELVSSYRDAQMANYRANSDVVGQWMWSAAVASACIACVDMDGTVHSMEEDLIDHVMGRCEPLPITRTWDDIMSQYGLSADGIPETSITESYGTGMDWFASQSADVQRSILGPAKFEAWEQGDISLHDLVGVREDGAWGGAIYERSLKEMGLDAQDYLPAARERGLGPQGERAIQEARAAIPEPEMVRVDMGNGMYTYMDPYDAHQFDAAANMEGRGEGWQNIDDVLAGLRGEATPAVEEVATGAGVSGEAGRVELQHAISEATSTQTQETFERDVLRPLAERLKGDPDWERLLEKASSGDITDLRYRLDQWKTDEGAARALIERWTVGNTPESVAMRLAAQEEFGLAKDLASVEKDAALLARVQSDYGDVLPGLRAFDRALYDQTQAWFEEHGITSVRLYRGLSSPEAMGADVRSITADIRPISSFTTDFDQAAEFASNYGEMGRVYALDVPVDHILSIPLTGLGEGSKSEVLILGGQYQGVQTGALKFTGSLDDWHAREQAAQAALGDALDSATGAATETASATETATAAAAAEPITVSFATDAVQTRLMERLDNPTEEQFARLMGAQPGDRVETNKYGQTFVRSDANDSYTTRFVTTPDAVAGQGMLLQEYSATDGTWLPVDEHFAAMLRTQAEAAHETGALQYITMKTRGRVGDYEELLKVGFDAPIDSHVLTEAQGAGLPPLLPAEFAEKFPGVKTLGELVSTPEGAAWWRENGMNPDLYFNLKPGSASIKTLNDYLTAHDLPLVGETATAATAATAATVTTTAEETLTAQQTRQLVDMTASPQEMMQVLDDARERLMNRLADDPVWQQYLADSDKTAKEAIEQFSGAFSGTLNVNERTGAGAGALEAAARDEFGLSSARAGYLESLPSAQDLYAQDGEVLRTYLRGVYDETQQYFRDQGITEVTLYRGEAGAAADKPFMSYSVSSTYAEQYADTEAYGEAAGVRELTVPVDRILGLPQTGIGNQLEGEVVVLADAQ